MARSTCVRGQILVRGKALPMLRCPCFATRGKNVLTVGGVDVPVVTSCPMRGKTTTLSLNRRWATTPSSCNTRGSTSNQDMFQKFVKTFHSQSDTELGKIEKWNGLQEG
jgi:hypothetical protein